jgi:hypothetical protein
VLLFPIRVFNLLFKEDGNKKEGNHNRKCCTRKKHSLTKVRCQRITFS